MIGVGSSGREGCVKRAQRRRQRHGDGEGSGCLTCMSCVCARGPEGGGGKSVRNPTKTNLTRKGLWVCGSRS